VDQDLKVPGVEPPRGFHQARVDEKGRCKLPAIVQQYLAAQGVKKVFITSLDLTTARLYPISVWEQNEKMLAEPGPAATQAKAISFMAKHYGADSELDAQGRVLVPQVLRRKLQMEDQQVWVGFDKGAFEMYSDPSYQAKLLEYEAAAAGALEELQKAGFK
jgi:MraZ protein